MVQQESHGTVTDTTPLSTDRGLVVRPIGTVSTAPETIAASTVTAVPAANADTPILAADPTRKGFEVHNASDKALYLLCGPGVASAALFTAILAPMNADGVGGHYSVPLNYTGQVRGFWPVGVTGNALVTKY